MAPKGLFLRNSYNVATPYIYHYYRVAYGTKYWRDTVYLAYTVYFRKHRIRQQPRSANAAITSGELR